MERAYLGESFELSFRIRDSRNPDRKVDTADYIVWLDDKAVDSGRMTVEGELVRFRFQAKNVGVHRIEVSWTMGQDRFKQPFLINVEALA